jgi:SAM-dependent methyltransferase
MENSKQATQELAAAYAATGNPNGWFEEFYARAGGDINKIYWADFEPNPLLIDWVENKYTGHGNRVAIIGCGLGDDAEALAQRGFTVVAFDISDSAISMCRKRFPNSQVNYLVADLFTPPVEWLRGFDLVYECNTVQILAGSQRLDAIHAITGLVAPGGSLVVSCRSRKSEPEPNTFPIPLDHDEINKFAQGDLTEIYFLSYDDDQEPPVPHYFAVYRRPD